MWDKSDLDEALGTEGRPAGGFGGNSVARQRRSRRVGSRTLIVIVLLAAICGGVWYAASQLGKKDEEGMLARAQLVERVDANAETLEELEQKFAALNESQRKEFAKFRSEVNSEVSAGRLTEAKAQTLIDEKLEEFRTELREFTDALARHKEVTDQLRKEVERLRAVVAGKADANEVDQRLRTAERSYVAFKDRLNEQDKQLKRRDWARKKQIEEAEQKSRDYVDRTIKPKPDELGTERKKKTDWKWAPANGKARPITGRD